MKPPQAQIWLNRVKFAMDISIIHEFAKSVCFIIARCRSVSGHVVWASFWHGTIRIDDFLLNTA